ncbi:M23 family metallopeptidase [Candidatus Wolfebacteria bacterium]|nr:M23 family metallopeptidase [Candidatus Wolfebacteria bacterium]
MAKFLKKDRFQAIISPSQAFWGFFILGVLGLNLAFLNKNSIISSFIANAFYQKNLGGPSIELKDSLIANLIAAEKSEKTMNNLFNHNSDYAGADALIQNLSSNQLPPKKPSNGPENKLFPPAIGWNWGQLHANNAIDIANSCGTPVYSAFEGFITEEAIDNNWNNGYGNYLKIEHPGEIETLYAHLDKAIVSLGQYVQSKELIGYIGNTGNTHGQTGCHLHYEVHGAKNPLAN